MDSQPPNPNVRPTLAYLELNALISAAAAQPGVGGAVLTEGYPGLVKFVNTDPDFLVFRRFGEMNVRNLLYMQDELAELEAQIKSCDERPGEKGSRRRDGDPERIEIIKKARALLKEYNEALLTYSSIMKLHPAEERQRSSVQNYLAQRNPLISDEQDYAKHHEDLLSMLPDEKDSLYRFLQKYEQGITGIFRPKKKDDIVYVYSHRWVKGLVTTLCLVGSWVFLLIPVWLLCITEERLRQLAIVAAFVITFSLVLAGAIKAKNWEILSCTAGYAAVLVVFMSSSGLSTSHQQAAQ